jgi:hypothetical protein
VVQPAVPDPGRRHDTLAASVATLRERLPFTQPLAAKEILRDDALAALTSYHSYVLQPLLTLCRIRHAPARHDFGARYTRDDLPADVQADLRELFFVADLDDLAAKLPRAQRLLRELADSLAAEYDHGDARPGGRDRPPSARMPAPEREAR